MNGSAGSHLVDELQIREGLEGRPHEEQGVPLPTVCHVVGNVPEDLFLEPILVPHQRIGLHPEAARSDAAQNGDASA